MVETISPVVHGGRTRSYWRAVGLHVAGNVVSATALGALLGGTGALLGAPWGPAGMYAVLVVALLYAGRELFALPIPLPDLDRQVPDWWRTFYSRETAAFLYGIGLGVGFLTYLSFGTLAAVGMAAVASGDPGVGGIFVGAFGLARGLSVLAATRADDPEDVTDRLTDGKIRRAGRLGNGIVLAAIALAAVASAL